MYKKKIITVVLPVVALLLGACNPVAEPASTPIGEEFVDDFSMDTGAWTYIGDAYRDFASEYVVLTEDGDWQVGVAWFNQSIFSPFTAEFRYKVGGGTGADGMVFMFYKQSDYTPGAGGHLGFSIRISPSEAEPVPGYGIEFDNYSNNGGGYGRNDPSSNHIALIKDDGSRHLMYVDDSRTEDNKWHAARIVVGNSTIEVYVDDELVITWERTIDRTYGGIGFSATTGDLTNWHIVDDVDILIPPVFP